MNALRLRAERGMCNQKVDQCYLIPIGIKDVHGYGMILILMVDYCYMKINLPP
jgi:hypothetical protein